MNPREEITASEATDNEKPVMPPTTSDTDELLLNAHNTVADLVPEAAIQYRQKPSFRDVGWRKWL